MNEQSLAQAYWRIYQRAERPEPWAKGGNLPWQEPDFSERMLHEHLDETHGAASRTAGERAQQLAWLWQTLGLEPGAHVLDVTCGPGLYAVPLAQRGVEVTGVDFGPAAIAFAGDLAKTEGVSERCHFVEADVRDFDFAEERYDAAIFLYGQIAVFSREEAQQLLARIAQALRPGGRLCLELLDQEKVDRNDSTWWFTDDKGLWGNGPFFSLGERFWYEEEKLSCERYYTVHLETGNVDEIVLCDQTYSVDEMTTMMRHAGYREVKVHPGWDELSLYDAGEWNVYVASK